MFSRPHLQTNDEARYNLLDDLETVEAGGRKLYYWYTRTTVDRTMEGTPLLMVGGTAFRPLVEFQFVYILRKDLIFPAIPLPGTLFCASKRMIPGPRYTICTSSRYCCHCQCSQLHMVCLERGGILFPAALVNDSVGIRLEHKLAIYNG